MKQHNLALIEKTQKETFYKGFLSEYSSSLFDDDIWFIDRCYQDKNEKKTIFFKRFNVDKNWLGRIKTWVVKLLMNERTLGTINNYLIRLNTFFRFSGVRQVDKKLIYAFSQNLFNKELSDHELRNSLVIWGTLKQFFYDLELWELYEAVNRIVVPGFPKSRRQDKRLIDSFVLKQLDEVFSKEELPNIFRGIYWTLRLIPNRITEVLSIKPDCLSETECGSFLLTIPQFKQVSPFNFSESKTIELIPEGIVSDYISILKEQQKRVQSFKKEYDFLFTDFIYVPKKEKDGFKVLYNSPQAYSKNMVNSMFERVIDFYNIKDQNGNTPRVTSHMPRHNNINDRIESGKFTPERIQTLSGHKSITMLEHAYIHPNLEETAKKLNESEENEKSFKSRILEPERLKKIATRPFAHPLGNLGVCSDIRKCQSEKYDCLACEFFDPEEMKPEKLKRELKAWERKQKLAQSTEDNNFAQICTKTINGLKGLIQRIEGGLNNV